MKPIITILTLFFCLTSTTPVLAQEQAWILSIPHAISTEHIYKVKIRAIDGEAQPEVFRYPASSGLRRVTVELMLDLEWEPDLRSSSQQLPIKEFELEISEGKTYLLAAQLDVNAPAESQLDQSYWEVFVYREY